jgi:hypothetical protein
MVPKIIECTSATAATVSYHYSGDFCQQLGPLGLKPSNFTRSLSLFRANDNSKV